MVKRSYLTEFAGIAKSRTMDIRHQKRTSIVQKLFAHSFHPNESVLKYDKKTQEIINAADEINKEIQTYASKFPLNKIARIDIAILQLAIYELIKDKKEPPKVIINEAVELAKELGGEKSYAFINAILGKIYSKNYA